MSTSFASFFRWLQRKRYQYEVTFSLYMLTPTEKFIFNSFIFLFVSMILIGSFLYLPQHINFLINRAWFYWHGDDAGFAESATAGKEFIQGASTRMADAAKETVIQIVGNNVEVLKDGVGAASGRGEL